VLSLGFDLDDLVAKKKICLDFVYIERSEIEETGEYDLEGLFIRLGHAIDTVGAKRVVLDTIEALFASLPSEGILRAELRRLFRWLKDRGMTAVITGERGEKSLTRYGLEEYVADCVLLLDNRVEKQMSTRRLRVVKYRGSAHGTNEYPFLIGATGILVMPITSLRLDHAAPEERVSTGIPGLDEMFEGGGVYRGSSVLVTGAPGTGKSSVVASFVTAACRRGERALVFAYEESSEQMVRNMRSIGIDLKPFIKKGLLHIHASRPTLQGLEQHLVTMYDAVNSFKPAVVSVDPMSDLAVTADNSDMKPTLIRLVDFMKRQQITAVFTSLVVPGMSPNDDASHANVSSLMDTWLLLQNVEYNGERNRTIFVLKSRGMGHSNQVREFVLTSRGVELVDIYPGSDTVLTGTARIAQAQRERAADDLRRRTFELGMSEIAVKQRAIAAQIAALQAEADAAKSEAEFLAAKNKYETESSLASSYAMAELRRSTQGKQTSRKVEK
jgi:circadian clock protein KaiC